MAFKFLNRPEAKQRVLRMDLARTAAPKGKEAERAIVVTAEVERLTYFWNDAAGEWQFHTRAHAPLRPLASAPDDTLGFPWSRRNGVAADGDLAVIAFKREVDEERSGLFLDVLAWSEADAAWQFVTEAKPLALPVTQEWRGVGLDVWAWLIGKELCLVVQAWLKDNRNPLQPAEPRLMLTRSTINLADLAKLERLDAWQATNLDAGGFDLDARFDEGRIWVAHRRTAAAMTHSFNPMSNSASVWMMDDAETLNVDPSLFVAEMPKTVVVSCDLASATVQVEADDIPSVEHPQLQRIRPLILTGDRLRFVEISAQRDGAQWRLQPHVRTAVKVAVWRGRDDWRVEPIGPLDQFEWPRNLTALAASHFMIAVREGRISFATRLYCKPTFLWRFEVTQKGVELTFGRENRRIGGVACDRFLVTPDLPSGSVEWTGRSVLDVGHEQIALDFEGNSEWPVENTQFEGVAAGEMEREDGVTLQFFFPTVNTLGGILVAHQDAGHRLCGYVGMGDGGGRVIFEPKIDPIEPTVTHDFKSLPVGAVSGPGGAGRAWVTLQAADFVPTRLPGYHVLYGDFMRRLPPPENQFDYLFRLAPLDLVLQHFTPRSIGGGLQPLIDVLPIANTLSSLTIDSVLSIEDIAPPIVDLTRLDAATIQGSLATLAAAAGASDPTNSDDTQPFGISFTNTPGRVQAGSPVTFSASVTDAGVTATTFRWTFTSSQSPGSFPMQVQGATPSITFPIDGEWTVRLRIDATDGRRSEINATVEVLPSLWSLLWLPYTEIGDVGRLRLGTTTLELLRYRIQYRVGADGSRERVHIDYLREHGTTFRFDAGVAAQQGRTTLRLPVILSSTDGRFDGLVGAAVTLARVDVRMNLERPFTLGVVTADRRSFDVLQRDFYSTLDSTEGAPVTPDEADVETVRHGQFEPGRAANMTPNALAAKPVGQTTVRLNRDDVNVEVGLTPLASGISFLLGFIVALNLVGPVIGPIIAALGPLAVGPLGLGVLIALAIAAGLGLLFILLAQAAATDYAKRVARDTLTSPENVAAITDALDEAGVMNYAGEGLAEAIAIKAIEQARADGHAVEPPAHAQPSATDPASNRPASGRERYRPQFFETVVVGPGECRVLLRVP